MLHGEAVAHVRILYVVVTTTHASLYSSSITYALGACGFSSALIVRLGANQIYTPFRPQCNFMVSIIKCLPAPELFLKATILEIIQYSGTSIIRPPIGQDLLATILRCPEYNFNSRVLMYLCTCMCKYGSRLLWLLLCWFAFVTKAHVPVPMDNNSHSRQLWWREPTPLAAWSALGRVGGVCWCVCVHVRTV